MSLAAQLERAVGPCRETDTAIAQAIGHEGDPPPWTGSFDAAMTLKPDGWRLKLAETASGDCQVSLFRPESFPRVATAKTIPNAIAAACMKVRRL